MRRTAIAGATKVVKADYSVPHLAHASMETTCAVADVQTDAHGKVTKCYLRAATQNPQAVQQSVGPAMGIPNDRVEVDVTLLGSGFGRKSKPDYCVEAALLSRELKRPVHMTWTREDDVQHDYYHAISAIHCEAAVGDNGRPVAWLQRVAYPSIGSTFSKGADRPATFEAEMGHTDLPYDVPNLQLEVCRAKAHTRIGWLRSVCHIQQNFAVGSFVDELAHAAGRDPLEYLLDALGDDRMIDLAAAKLSQSRRETQGLPLRYWPIEERRAAGGEECRLGLGINHCQRDGVWASRAADRSWVTPAMSWKSRSVAMENSPSIEFGVRSTPGRSSAPTACWLKFRAQPSWLAPTPSLGN